MIAQAQAELTATAAEISRSKNDVDRYRSLAQDQSGIHAALAAGGRGLSEGAGGRCQGARGVEAAQRQLDVIDTQKQQTEAALAGAIADRDTAQLNVGYTELRAPIDGTIGNRSARNGAYASVGAQFISLVPAHGLWVDANFKESQLAHMRAGHAGDDRGRRAAGRSVPWPCRRAWRRRPVPCSACCRRRMPPATSPRSCSACRCACCSMATRATLGRLRPGLSVTARR